MLYFVWVCVRDFLRILAMILNIYHSLLLQCYNLQCYNCIGLEGSSAFNIIYATVNNFHLKLWIRHFICFCLLLIVSMVYDTQIFFALLPLPWYGRWLLKETCVLTCTPGCFALNTALTTAHRVVAEELVGWLAANTNRVYGYDFSSHGSNL